MGQFTICRGNSADLAKITELYNELIDTLEKGINYPGWEKYAYPAEDTAAEGIKDGTIYVMRDSNRIAGTVILNNIQPEAYNKLKWKVAAGDDEVLVVHTLAVHPDYFKCGIATRLLMFAEDLARSKKIKAIRLDTSDKNSPAAKLYEKCGYTLIGKVDLGLNIPGLEIFKCFEKSI